MAGSFVSRISHLQETVGVGPLEGVVNYDQRYAVVMETGHWDNYRGWGSPPQGEGFKPVGYHSGGPHFLRNGLYGQSTNVLQRIADHVLDGDQGALIRAMADGTETICHAASAGAPIEFGDLRESDHAQVFDDGALVYDRPALVGPLSSETLGRKRRTKSPHRGGSGERTYLPEGHLRRGTVHPHYGGPTPERPHANPDLRSEREHIESWDITALHFYDRRLAFRTPTRTDPYALHRNPEYDFNESDTFGEWTDAEYAREVRGRRHRRPPEAKPKSSRDRLSSWDQHVIDENF